MKKHPILFGFLILLAVVYIFNVFNSSDMPAPSKRPAKITAKQVADMIDDSCRKIWGSDFYSKLNEDQKTFTVTTWQSSIDDALIRRTSEGGDIGAWNDMVSNMKETANTMQAAFRDCGLDDYTAVLCLADPVSHSTTYLVIAQGVAGYDVVNGIDLLNQTEHKLDSL